MRLGSSETRKEGGKEGGGERVKEERKEGGREEELIKGEKMPQKAKEIQENTKTDTKTKKD